ncbi:unnamed protein product [Acanthoscelides obtectus]|uniref:UDENN domain-containing protein n=1 Tax=Acanthoscelides obtectus TaxID=200917 RepID=A0A9P0QGM7_ACAOB|nr:unnamed protein product [Acanthoscelides obtectus]CAK1626978.1 Late secretory pathway protein AVL9 homolog [Acanthoscelides obtectus]
MSENEEPILYVLVVGFHHKKGCQVEYSYPELYPGHPNECPPGWKYLPTLALPDGSHNYDTDTVFFHLPSLASPKQTVYGISCFRQIPVEKIKNKTSDITRGTVQKSVCVLSRVPLYGQIQVKMHLITHAYFEKGDFSKVSILEETFHHLNAVMKQYDMRQHSFVGLSAKEFILQWKNKALQLFKLLLLEKRVMFFKSPVHPLCSTILTLSRPMSPMPEYSDEELSPVLITKYFLMAQIKSLQKMTKTSLTRRKKNGMVERNCSLEGKENDSEVDNTEYALEVTESLDNHRSCGFPLSIYTKGSYVYPIYLCLTWICLSDVNVRSYIVGTTNFLFKQKRQLYDVLVDIDSGRIECPDINLRKYLHLTTEDLRFAEYLVKHASEESQDDFLDGVGWEGSEEWIRTQFRVYLLCLLRTSMIQDGARELDHFNSSFITAWRETHNYKITMQNTESGRKLNQAMATTGKAVANTGKAVVKQDIWPTTNFGR